MILSKANSGEVVTVKTINGGMGMRSRLFALGLVSGTRLTVLSNSGGGPVILDIREGRVAVGRGMDEKIVVQ